MKLKLLTALGLILTLTSCGIPQSIQQDELTHWVRQKICESHEQTEPTLTSRELTEEEMDLLRCHIPPSDFAIFEKVFALQATGFTPGKRISTYFINSLKSHQMEQWGTANENGEINWHDQYGNYKPPFVSISETLYGEAIHYLVTTDDQTESASLLVVAKPIIAKDEDGKTLEIQTADNACTWIYKLSGFNPHQLVQGKITANGMTQQFEICIDENGNYCDQINVDFFRLRGNFSIEISAKNLQEPLEAKVYLGLEALAKKPYVSPQPL